jgi:hypothetical protein
VIKIDRSFVSDMTTSADSPAIVRSIIGLAGNMNMLTIAEGVETEETTELLVQMNVDALQGYLIGRPMPVEEIPSWRVIWTTHGSPDASPPEPAVRPAHLGVLLPANDLSRGTETTAPEHDEVPGRYPATPPRGVAFWNFAKGRGPNTGIVT